MNKAFYEFWGNYLLTLAHGHQQTENLSALMKQGLSGMNDLAALFRRCYGIEADTADGTDSASSHWQDAMEDFKRAMNQFAGLWGWVPQADHQRVVRDRDDLQKQVQKQEVIISELRALLNEEGRGHAVLVDHWKRSIKEQNDQFQALMESIRSSFGKG